MEILVLGLDFIVLVCLVRDVALVVEVVFVFVVLEVFEGYAV